MSIAIFDRLFERIEHIAGIPTQDVMNVIENFRRICMAGWRNSDGELDIDPAKTKDRKRYATSDNFPFFISEDIRWVPQSCVARLLSAPRTLKLTLRRTWGAWQELHGEVDFDDLLSCNTLRYTAESVYQFLREHYGDMLPSKGTGLNEEEVKKQRQELATRWNALIEKEYSAVKAREVHTLVEYLFCGWGEPDGVMGHQFGRSPLPQGIAANSRYWLRVENEALDPAEFRDQPVFHALSEYRSGKSSEKLVAGLLPQKAFADRLEELATSNLRADLNLRPPDIRELASSCMAKERFLTDFGNFNAQHIPGTEQLWRVANRKGRYPKHIDWLCDEFHEHLRFDLKLAENLLYYWGSMRVGDFVRQEDLPGLRNRITAMCIEWFAEVPSETLVDMCNRPHAKWALYQLIHEIWHEDKTITIPGDWQPVFKWVVKALESFPTDFLMPVLELISKSGDPKFVDVFDEEGESDRRVDHEITLDIAFLHLWAGDEGNVVSLLKMVTQLPLSGFSVSPDRQQWYDSVVKDACEYLANNSDSPQ